MVTSKQKLTQKEFDKILKPLKKAGLPLTGFISIRGVYQHKWWMVPICWILKHKKRKSSIYGINFKQCSRCGKEYHNSKTLLKERQLQNYFYPGEVGELYGVKFYFKHKTGLHGKTN